ncbi:hypothetical protein AOLI_G00076510 [Acnodon oligacanthus]
MDTFSSLAGESLSQRQLPTTQRVEQPDWGNVAEKGRRTPCGMRRFSQISSALSVLDRVGFPLSRGGRKT